LSSLSDLLIKKKVVTDLDIEALVQQKTFNIPETYRLKRFVINSGSTITATATVYLETLEFPKEAVSTGDGPIDAAFKAIDQIVGIEFELDTFTINAVSEGKDAQGEVIVKLAKDGKLYTGRGLSTDIIESSIKAYLNAINKMLDELRYTKRIDADD